MFSIFLLSRFVLGRPFGNIIHDVAQKYNGLLSIPQLRKLEKLCNKVRKADLDINFLRNCRHFGVIPKFLCFTIQHADNVDVFAIRKRLLKSALNKRCKEKATLANRLAKDIQNVRQKVTCLDWYILKKAIDFNVERISRNFIAGHESKLQRLTRNSTLPFRSDEIIKNFSSYQLSQDEEIVLKYGFSFWIHPPFLRNLMFLTALNSSTNS